MYQQRSTMLKVLCPVEGRNGKTFWIRVGNAFVNRDGSINIYLNAYPMSGKLQLRALDERPSAHEGDGAPGDELAGHPAAGPYGHEPHPEHGAELPF
jgi:hypothetical protein